MHATVTKSCLTLWDPMDCIVDGILLARILEWVTVPFSRGSSQHTDRTQVSHIASRFYTSWATRESIIHYFTLIIRRPEINPNCEILCKIKINIHQKSSFQIIKYKEILKKCQILEETKGMWHNQIKCGIIEEKKDISGKNCENLNNVCGLVHTEYQC